MTVMELNFKSYGQGEPIIILHGLLGMLDNWHAFAKQLSEEYWVITLDLRNHGKSPHSSAFNYDLLAEDIDKFMEQHYIPYASFIGHSMGGKALLNLINRHPSRVNKAFVIDISPRAYRGGHEHIFAALQDMPLESLSSRGEAFEKLNTLLDDEGTSHFLLKNLQRNKQSGFSWKANVEALQSNYESIKAGIKYDMPSDVPTYFIRGSRSNYIVEEDVSIIQEMFEESHIYTIEDAGHWVHADQPDRLIELIQTLMVED